MKEDKIEERELKELEKAQAATQAALLKEEERANKMALKRHKLETESRSYASIKWIAKIFDNWFLDPIIGFVLPGLGDALTTLLSLPSMYVSLVKVRSLRLFIAIMFNTTLDLLAGLIPVVGPIADIFIRSNRKNYKLIVGFVEDDREIKRKVNQMVFIYFFLIFVMAGLIVLVFTILESIFGAIYDFIGSLF